MVELYPEIFFRPFTRFEISTAGKWRAKLEVSLVDQEALGEVTAELTQLELAYWRDISELLCDRDQSTADSGERS